MQGGIIILNRIANENASNHGIGVLELIDENQAAKGPSDGQAIFAPLKRTELAGDIVGPLATLCLTQIYSFTKEQCAKVLEARYRFPVSGDAAVTGVKVCFGDVELATELKDRNQAKQEYKEAKREGQQAVMVTRESPDVFTICIAGLEPGQEVKVETRYVQMARADGNGWSVRIPLTTAPRYVRKDETSSRYAQGQPLAVLRDPGHRFALDVNFHGASSIQSPTHRIHLATEGGNLRARLLEGEVIPDRDCVLQWKPLEAKDRPALNVLVQADDRADETYFLALVSPPATPVAKKVQGEYVLLVDHSGSMEGAKWAAADWAVEKFLRSLDETDYFTLGVFHNVPTWYSRSVLTASESNIDGAIEFLQKNRESGGTELGMALEQALQISRMGRDLSRHLLLITDAEVSDEGRILRLAGEEALRPDRRRISILCIDAAPNSFLALELAERGGGIARFLTSDPGEGDITTALDGILETWSRPVYANLRLFCDRQVVAADRDVVDIGNGRCYVSLGDMPAGQPVWVSGRLPGKGQDRIAFCLMTRDGKKIEPLMPDMVTRLEGEAGIRPFFGARKLLGLEFLIHSRYGGNDLREGLRRLGYDPEQALYQNKAPSLYPENNTVNETASLRDLIVAESLKYGLPSSETALIAVYHQAGKRTEATALVPNALPEGWSERFESRCMSPPVPSPSCSSPGSASRVSLRSGGAGRKSGKVLDTIIDVVDCDGADTQKLSSTAHLVRTPAKNTRYDEEVMGIDADSSGVSIRRSQPVASTGPLQYAAKEDQYAGRGREECIFDGVPQFYGGQAVLFDSTVRSNKSDSGYLISQIRIQYPGSSPSLQSVGNDLSLYIYVDDMVAPRASMKLADIMRNACVRPINIIVRPGEQVKVVLADPAGVWAGGAPKLAVSLRVS